MFTLPDGQRQVLVQGAAALRSASSSRRSGSHRARPMVEEDTETRISRRDILHLRQEAPGPVIIL